MKNNKNCPGTPVPPFPFQGDFRDRAGEHEVMASNSLIHLRAKTKRNTQFDGKIVLENPPI